MSIIYQRKTAPLQAGCCFLPTSSSKPPQFLSPSSKVFRTQSNKISVLENQRPLDERKEGILAMKKSISSINLKRKNSQGYQTNRASLNQSQFVNRLQKKMTTHSMDSELFKQYFPANENLIINTPVKGYSQFKQENNSPILFNNFATLDSLADKFKKTRQIQHSSNIQLTKKYAVRPYENSKYHQNQNLQKTHNHYPHTNQPLNNYKQFQKQQSYQNQKLLVIEQKQRHIQNMKNLKNPEQVQFQKVVTEKKNIFHSRNQNKVLSFEMNQVDSMIISVNPPKNHSVHQKVYTFKKSNKSFHQMHNVAESIHIGEENIAKTRKRHITHTQNLFDNETGTVNSDYEEDEHQETEKIQQSAIMMNFFNPPSFIKDKLGLSRSHNRA